MQKKKGFTLIELLIVVVIIAVLAALLLPRILSQPERAIVAEGTQMVGVLRRAQLNLKDSTGSDVWVDATATNGVCNSDWQRLGVGCPDTSAKFNYACGAGWCVAERKAGNDYAGNHIGLSLTQGTFDCGSPDVGTKPYQAVANNSGCTS